MQRNLIAIVLVAAAYACGPKVKFPSDDRPEREIVDCPTGPALDRTADAAWNTARLGEGAEHAVTCVPLYAHEPLWLLDGSVANEDFGVTATALVTPKGEVRWTDISSNLELETLEYDNKVPDSFVAADLDGDGHDELLHVAGLALAGTRALTITPWSIVAGKVTTGKPLPLSLDDSEALPRIRDQLSQVCLSTHEVIDAPRGRHLLVITGAADATLTGAGCPLPGRHLYGWDGSALVEE